MFNLESFIPKLCTLAQEAGDDERAKSIRLAAMQALSSMVLSMLTSSLSFSSVLYNRK